MKTNTLSHIVIVFLALGIVWSVLQILQTPSLYASAPPGLPATVATSTRQDVIVTAARVIVATSTNCAARVISTGQSAVLLTFSDPYVPTTLLGHWQAASTTETYDGGQFGCGNIRAINVNAAASIVTVTETR